MKIVRLLVFLLMSGVFMACRAADTAESPSSPTGLPTPQEEATSEPVELPNPASVNCEEQGFTLEMRQGEDGTYGVCLFADGSECEEWAYLRGECQPGDSRIEPTASPVVTATAAAGEETWQHYTNEMPAYTFLYPPLAVIEPDNDPRQAVTITGPLVENEHWPMFFIGHAPDRAEFRPPQDVDLQQWLIAQGLLAPESETPPGEDPQVQRRIGGVPAVHTRLERGQQSYASDQYFFAHDGQLYSIVILHTGDREDWDLYNQFLDSFQFLPGVTPEQSYQPDPGGGLTAGIDDYGVSFQFDTALAASVQPHLVDAFVDDNGMDYLLLPQHLAFTFDDSYADGQPLLQRQQLNLATMPQIVVYPADAYAAMQPLAKTQIDQLQALLAEEAAAPGGSLPYLPLHNAAQVFHSQLAHLPFRNGAGVRYVTAFSQEASPVTNQQLIYTYQGLTDDGRYYVTAFFPLTTAVLPDTVQVEDWEAFNANYSTYVRETLAALNDLTPQGFSPGLTLLDAVVTSLQVNPGVALAGAETAVLLEEPGRTGPVGVYQVYDGDNGLYCLYREETDGRYQQVAEQRYPLLPAPDAAHAVYMDDDQHLWLVDLLGGSERQLAEGADLSGSYLWGDARTLLLGVYLSALEREALSAGHLATLDIESDDLQVIDEEYVSLKRPAMAPDGQSIAYDIAPGSSAEISSRIYRPGGGSQPLDPALFAGLEGEPECSLYNPAWSPDGRQLAWLCSGEAGSRLIVFDLVQQTAMSVFAWQPAQFGALPPSAVWSSDGKWLAIEIWANNEEESGVWILPADGTLARLHVATGHEPIWLNASQLIYADLDENMNGDIKLFDLDSGETRVMDFPAGSQILLTPPYTSP
jgi:putative hemolysin